MYLETVFVNHDLSKLLIMNRVIHFTRLFWKNLFSFFKSNLAILTAYHTQIDGEMEKTNRFIEYMLQTFTLEEQEE